MSWTVSGLHNSRLELRTAAEVEPLSRLVRENSAENMLTDPTVSFGPSHVWLHVLEVLRPPNEYSQQLYCALWNTRMRKD